MTSVEILKEIKSIFGKEWKTRAGNKVPEADSISLGNDAVTLSGTVLYADLADSTDLVNGFKPWFAAEVYKAYLLGACRVIRERGGEITAFDGDRVMSVFTGSTKNTNAAKAALQINHIVLKTNEILHEAYPTTTYKIQHKIGIDTSELFIAKTGIRDANDLIWVGRAANYAAKLSALSNQNYPTHITEDVYKMLHDEAKYGGQEKKSMWVKQYWTDRQMTIYCSNWWWAI